MRRWPALAAATLLGCNMLADLDDMRFPAEGGNGLGNGAAGAAGGAGGGTGAGESGNGGVTGQAGAGGTGGSMPGCADTSRHIAFLSATDADPSVGMVGLDAVCQSEADNAGCGKTFVAWISSDETISYNASMRIPSGTWGLPHGPDFANDNADLLNGSLDHPLNVTVDGSELKDTLVWTGTLQDGSGAGEDCDGWTNQMMALDGRIGNASAEDYTWTNYSLLPCSTVDVHLFCFEAP